MANLGSTQIFGDLIVNGQIKNVATTETEGVVKLNNTIDSTSTTEAATAYAVKMAYDKANHTHDFSSITHTHNYAGSILPGGAATTSLACSGNAETATKLKTAVTINGISFNGSSNITIEDSTKLSLTGGTLTGVINFANNTWNKVGDDVSIGDCNIAGKIGIKGLNGATGIHFVPFSGTVTQSIAVDGAGNLTISGNTYGSFFGNISGNATTASKLLTAINVTIGSKTYALDGSSNLNYTLADIGAAPSSHTHNYAATSHTHSEYSLTSHTHSGFAPSVHTHDYAATTHSHNEYALTTHSHTGFATSTHGHNYAGSSSDGGAATSALTCTGNAATATKLATPRTIYLANAVTGSVAFDGSLSVSLSTKLNSILIPNTANLNDYKEPGFFYSTTGSDTILNAPPDSCDSGFAMTINRCDNNIVQFVYEYNCGEWMYRIYSAYSNNWSQWWKFLAENSEISPSQLSGQIPISKIPTGTTNTTVALGNHSHSNYVIGRTGTGGDSVIINALSNSAAGTNAFAQGAYASASGDCSHAEGNFTKASGMYSHAEGIDTTASLTAAHAEGSGTSASGIASHAEGTNTTASGENAHAEGYDTNAFGIYSHAEGISTIANGYAAHAEGEESTAYQEASHAEGYNTYAKSIYSHTEGYYTEANGYAAHAEGHECIARGIGSHAEGMYCVAGLYMGEDEDVGSHAEGISCIADGVASHAEGDGSRALWDYSHAEGSSTANAAWSHSEGDSTITYGMASHAEGLFTTADTYLLHVQGRYNKKSTGGTSSIQSSTQNAFVIGNGTSSINLSNAFRVTFGGATYGLSAFNSTGADYAEYFEWLDGNLENEDRVGYFVTLDGDKIKIASSKDYIVGIISGNASVIGNANEDQWSEMYMRDEFGRFVYEEVEVDVMHTEYEPSSIVLSEELESSLTKKSKSKLIPGKDIEKRIKLNPSYDANKEYIPRSERQEWDTVGMLGQIPVRDDGTCEPNGFCTVTDEGIATQSSTGYRVMKRLSDNSILIVFK